MLISISREMNYQCAMVEVILKSLYSYIYKYNKNNKCGKVDNSIKSFNFIHLSHFSIVDKDG